MNSPQIEPRDTRFLYHRAVVDEHVVKYRNWYARRARYVRYFFRISGLGVIAASSSIPVLAALEFANKDVIIGTIGVLIVSLTAVRNFFRWDHVWAIVRTGDFELTFMEAQWSLRLAELEEMEDQDEALRLAHEATKELVERTRVIVRKVSDDYFSLVVWPQGPGENTSIELNEYEKTDKDTV